MSSNKAHCTESLAQAKCHDVLENANPVCGRKLFAQHHFLSARFQFRPQWPHHHVHWNYPSRISHKVGPRRQPRRIFFLHSVLAFAGGGVAFERGCHRKRLQTCHYSRDRHDGSGICPAQCTSVPVGARRKRHLWFGLWIIRSGYKSLGRRIVRRAQSFRAQYPESRLGNRSDRLRTARQVDDPDFACHLVSPHDRCAFSRSRLCSITGAFWGAFPRGKLRERGANSWRRGHNCGRPSRRPVFRLCRDGSKYIGLVRDSRTTSHNLGRNKFFAHAIFLLCRSLGRPRRECRNSFAFERSDGRGRRAFAGSGRRAFVLVRTLGHRAFYRRVFCRAWLVQPVSDLCRLALQVVRRARKKSRGCDVRASSGRQRTDAAARRNHFASLGQLAYRPSRSRGRLRRHVNNGRATSTQPSRLNFPAPGLAPRILAVRSFPWTRSPQGACTWTHDSFP